MRIDTALLCDAATVREGLLNVLGGGITVVAHPAYPADLGVVLALRIMVHPTEMASSHRLEILIQGEDGEQITKVDAEVGVGDPTGVPPGDEGEMLIAWNFPGRPKLPSPGRYSFEILIDGNHQTSIPLRAIEGATIPPLGGQQ